MSDRSVTAYIANLNTARVTELCIRSMREFSGVDFTLVVGDCGSTDGSLRMLERFASHQWLELEVAPNGRSHADWLDRWLRECPTRYALFSDSDVEFVDRPWLADMLDTAERTGAALVCGRMQHGAETFVHPVTRAERRIAPRPTAWLFMIDTTQVRDRVRATFEYLEVEDFDAFGGKVAYDTGAWYFKELCDAGLTWAEMPTWWQHKYHHFGGLTWLGPTRSGPAWRVRARQAAKLVLVEQHLYQARHARTGANDVTAPGVLAKHGFKWSVHTLDRLRPRPRGVTVLIYHRVGARTDLDVDLPLAAFEAQMETLAASGRVRSIDDALDALDTTGPARADADPLVITFDDGTADFAELAHPVLERHGLPATIYVATDFVDRGVDFPGAGRPLTWGALRDVAASGLVTVGSHTHTHALLDRLPAPAIADELDRADALIGEHVGGAVRHFAYPKAVAGSSPADAAVRVRYRSATLAGTRPNPYRATDAHRLARSPIQTSDGMRFFAAKVAGGMRLEDTLRDAANRWRYRGQVG